MNKTLLCTLLTLTIIFLTGCNKLKEGYVVSKNYEPTTQQIMLMPITVYNGKTTTTTFVPYFVTDYEDWVVTIKGIYKNKIKIENFYVSEKTYNSLEIGSFFTLTKDQSQKDNNNKTKSLQN